MKTYNIPVQFIDISTDDINQRIDNFLIARLKGIPKSMIYRIVRKGEVRVNKGRIKPEYKLQNGDRVRIPPVRVAKHKTRICCMKLDKISSLNNYILFEDDGLLILNKPFGMSVHGGSGVNFGIIEALRALRPKNHFLELVHRLDRDTSGILLIAKKRSALRVLHEQLRLKKMKKDYLTLVKGHWPSDCKKIKAPLLKRVIQNNSQVVKVSSAGKVSETHFKIEEYFENATLLKASPITGRTHQIRVHTLHGGHPIAFDNRYGDREFDYSLKETGLNRLFLHAITLCCQHPLGGTLFITAPLDDQLNHCLKILRKKPVLFHSTLSSMSENFIP